MSRLSLGIDIGGTFSDLVVYDADREKLFCHKELTTHDDPARGVLAGVETILERHGLPGSRIGRVVHATTLFTNALVERKGAMTGLLTTAGFRDVIEIGRERRFELYDLEIRRPDPLVPRNLRRDVPERMDKHGKVRVPLDVDTLLAETRFLADQGVSSIAIVFLHSYAEPAHERMAADAIRKQFPDMSISCSYEIAPVIRENERASTTVANAFVKPLANRYFQTLETELAKRGVSAPILMMLPSGGLTSLADVKLAPIKVLESGPAAGVIAAAQFGAEDNFRDLMAFDMGGTTAKLCVVEDGEPSVTYLFEAARQKRFLKGSGMPIRISTVELIEIGAGGGSIAHRDHLGLIKVGPQSAGADPGPASYGLGGQDPTVTDANFVLGYLDPADFAGGSITIEPDKAGKAIARLARESSLPAERVAWGIVDVVNENMAGAARVHIAEHGRDPSHFVLVATGGGGPLHGYYVGKKLGVRQVLCPSGAGVASAIGLLRAPARVDEMNSVVVPLETLDWRQLEEAFGELESRATALLAATGADARRSRVQRLADIRFVGQAFEVVVGLPDGPYTRATRPAIMKAFERRYVEKYSRSPRNTQVEIINIRVSVTADAEDFPVSGANGTPASRATALKGRRKVFFPEYGKFRNTPVYDRLLLRAGQLFDGPAVIEEPMSTIVVGPGGRFRVRNTGHVLVDIA